MVEQSLVHRKLPHMASVKNRNEMKANLSPASIIHHLQSRARVEPLSGGLLPVFSLQMWARPEGRAESLIAPLAFRL